MKGNFQIITIIVFIALAIFGVLVFSGAIPIGNKNEVGGQGTVVLWGTVKAGIMSNLLEEFRYSNQIATIPYQSYPLSSFKNTFAGAGEVFLTSKGILAIPISIDPLVKYYNRSTLDANGVVYPPAFWDEVSLLVPVLTKRDELNRIIKSTVAMGHFSNVNHAKDIISTLFMQVGNEIVTERDGNFISALSTSSSKYNLASILKFYTDFADPNSSIYSWNKSFPNSNVAFSREALAFYFGFASELASLVNANPNQNFFVSPVPQNRNLNSKLTNAHVTGLALLSSSRNFDTAFTVANLITTGDFASKFALATGVAPARRDLLQIKPENAYSPIFYNSALFAKSWLDPSPKNTDDIWRRMVDGVLSNSMSVENAIQDANSKLDLLLLR